MTAAAKMAGQRRLSIVCIFISRGIRGATAHRHA
jgi:hypothetical protein